MTRNVPALPEHVTSEQTRINFVAVYAARKLYF